MTDIEIAICMKEMGGSFASALGECFLRADAGNRERLKAAFPDLFEQYLELAQIRKAPR